MEVANALAYYDTAAVIVAKKYSPGPWGLCHENF
jgi:hypothetical protein